MTGYGRASVNSALGKIVVEIHSINRKMLDMSLYLPKELLCFDIEVRKWLAKFLERGQITLRLNLQRDRASDQLSPHYLDQLKNLKQGWDKLCRELGYDPTIMVDLPFLVSQLPFALEKECEEAEMKPALKEAVDGALADLMHMKEAEGEMLAVDIQKRLTTLEEIAVAVEGKKEVPLEHYRKKLIERLKEVGHLDAEVAERIAREVALLAERMDITEELVRLKAHIEQFRCHLLAPEKSVGRTLDFLAQEMHREINTLGSKSVDSTISLHVVKLKGELDKIREQVQNIE